MNPNNYSTPETQSIPLTGDSRANEPEPIVARAPRVIDITNFSKQDRNIVMRAERDRFRMLRYVVGIVLSPDTERVLLIHKSPDCEIPALRDTWNGVGGKQGREELPRKAMRRECREETGLDIPDWTLIDVITDNAQYRVHVFMATTPRIDEARTMEKEEVGIFSVELARTMPLSPGLLVSLEKAVQYA